MIEKFIKAKDIAEILRVSPALAFRLIATGQIPALRFGRTVRIRESDFEKFVSSHINSTPTGTYKIQDKE